MNDLKTYTKYYVKRHPGSGVILQENGEKATEFNHVPLIGDKIRVCRIDDITAKKLNADWFLTGIYYQETKETISEKDVRAGLFLKAEKMVEAGDLDKMPAKNIKTEDLKELVK